jgi:hypothetical protein
VRTEKRDQSCEPLLPPQYPSLKKCTFDCLSGAESCALFVPSEAIVRKYRVASFNPVARSQRHSPPGHVCLGCTGESLSSCRAGGVSTKTSGHTGLAVRQRRSFNASLHTQTNTSLTHKLIHQRSFPATSWWSKSAYRG